MPSIILHGDTFWNSCFFFALVLYHWFVLTKPSTDIVRNDKRVVTDFFVTFGAFLPKGIWLSIVFILLYRLGEAQLVKLHPHFYLTHVVLGLRIKTPEVVLCMVP